MNSSYKYNFLNNIFNMSDLVVIPKPESVSYEEIRDLLHRTHEANASKGFIMKTAFVTVEDLKRIHENGQCFVALLGGELIGTASFSIVEGGRKWYEKRNKIAFCKYGGIAPEYYGKGVFKELVARREEAAKCYNCNMLKTGTHEKNKRMIFLFKKQGMIPVDYIAGSDSNYYSVIYAKWLNQASCPKWYCYFRYYMARLFTRLRWLPGHCERFVVVGCLIKMLRKSKVQFKSLIKR